jgi:hypothetical protein
MVFGLMRVLNNRVGSTHKRGREEKKKKGVERVVGKC